MAEKLDDLNLPNAAVQRIIKEAISEEVFVGKEARTALGRAASVFVLYITSSASNLAKKANRKTVSGQDVLDAIVDLEFADFLPQLKEYQESLRENLKKKKEASAKSKKQKTEENSAETEPAAEDDEVEMVEDEEEDAE